MGSLLVNSIHLTLKASKSITDVVGKPFLKSLKEQRRENILCDVSIHCGNEQIAAHRCILYALSGYCRTLFTGSIPPTYRDGMLIMDLGLFSSDTVKVFIAFLYGEVFSKVGDVDIAELLKLGDYLQLPPNFLTEILRDIISTENCVRLFEFALIYNCCPLRKIVESFICNHLHELFNLLRDDDDDGDEVIESYTLELSEDALSSLLSNPLYLAQPVEMIGATAKDTSNNIDIGYKLITYYSDQSPQMECLTWCVESNKKMTVHNVGVYDRKGNSIDYFVFQYELYAIISVSSVVDYSIYKYNLQKRRFCPVLYLSDHASAIPNYIQILPHSIQLPPEFPKIVMGFEIVPLCEEKICILFRPSGPDVWLLKLSFGLMKQPGFELERIVTGMDSYRSSIFCKRSLYFFKYTKYVTYNFDSRSITCYELQGLLDEDEPDYCSYCEFQNIIYLFVESDDFDESDKIQNKIKVYYLNEEDLCWVFLSEHDIPASIIEFVTTSSNKEMVLALTINLSKNEDVDDFKRLIGRYDPDNKELTLAELLEFESSGDHCLFVPEDMFL